MGLSSTATTPNHNYSGASHFSISHLQAFPKACTAQRSECASPQQRKYGRKCRAAFVDLLLARYVRRASLVPRSLSVSRLLGSNRREMFSVGENRTSHSLTRSCRVLGSTKISQGHSAFADQRMTLFSSRFQHAENPLLCPSGAKRAQIAGILEDCWLKFVNLRRRKTVWWTKSRANHSPPPNPVNKPNLGPNWSNLPLPGTPDRM